MDRLRSLKLGWGSSRMGSDSSSSEKALTMFSLLGAPPNRLIWLSLVLMGKANPVVLGFFTLFAVSSLVLLQSPMYGFLTVLWSSSKL
jgi:hypothetical protein